MLTSSRLTGRLADNISLLDGNGRISAHLKNRGFSITSHHVASLMNRIREDVLEGDVVVIALNLPDGVESTAYVVPLYSSFAGKLSAEARSQIPVGTSPGTAWVGFLT